MAQIIGIIGLAGSGKDTLANAMQDRFLRCKTGSRIAGFADPIRKICYATGLLDPYNRGTKEVPVTVSRDLFCDSLQGAIDVVLRDDLSQYSRNKLYDLMVKHTEKLLSPPVGSSYTQYMNISPRQFMQILGTEAGQNVTDSAMWVRIAMGRWFGLPGTVLVTDFRFPHEAAALDEIVVVLRPGLERINRHVSEDLADELSREQPTCYRGRRITYAHNTSTREALQEVARDVVERVILR